MVIAPSLKLAEIRRKVEQQIRQHDYRIDNAKQRIEEMKDNPNLKSLLQEWRSELFHTERAKADLLDILRVL